MLLRSMLAFAFAAVLVPAGLPQPRAARADPAPPRAAGADLERARGLAASGEYRRAAAVLEADRNLSGDAAAEQYLGDLYVRLDDLKAAERIYLALLAVDRNNKTVHERLANAYAAGDAIPQAIAEFQASLPDVVAYTDLVRLHRRIGDLPAFVERYRLAADTPSSGAADTLAYGVILTELHRASEAASYLERAVAATPRSCPARTALGNAYLDLDRASGAAYQFRECLAVEPRNYSALVDLSTTYDPQRESASARALLDAAIRFRPELPDAFVDYGYLVDATAPGSGIAYYRRALANDVFSRDAYVDLGFDYAEERSFALAEAAYLKGLSVSPKDGRLEFLLGETYSRQGKAALSAVQYAAAASSDDPDVARAARSELDAVR